MAPAAAAARRIGGLITGAETARAACAMGPMACTLPRGRAAAKFVADLQFLLSLGSLVEEL